MPQLSANERREIWAQFMEELSSDREPIAVTKNDLRAAVDAIDFWVNSTASAFNQAIPQPARSMLTARQKARLFMAVVRRRFEVS